MAKKKKPYTIPGHKRPDPDPMTRLYRSLIQYSLTNKKQRRLYQSNG